MINKINFFLWHYKSIKEIRIRTMIYTGKIYFREFTTKNIWTFNIKNSKFFDFFRDDRGLTQKKLKR